MLFRSHDWDIAQGFFFSSRRRHTIDIGDWSSDVCSSDLEIVVLKDRDELFNKIHDTLKLPLSGYHQLTKSLELVLEIGRAS